jgi:hypothetical protein
LRRGKITEATDCSEVASSTLSSSILYAESVIGLP